MNETEVTARIDGIIREHEENDRRGIAKSLASGLINASQAEEATRLAERGRSAVRARLDKQLRRTPLHDACAECGQHPDPEMTLRGRTLCQRDYIRIAAGAELDCFGARMQVRETNGAMRVETDAEVRARVAADEERAKLAALRRSAALDDLVRLSEDAGGYPEIPSGMPTEYTYIGTVESISETSTAHLVAGIVQAQGKTLWHEWAVSSREIADNDIGHLNGPARLLLDDLEKMHAAPATIVLILAGVRFRRELRDKAPASGFALPSYDEMRASFMREMKERCAPPNLSTNVRLPDEAVSTFRERVAGKLGGDLVKAGGYGYELPDVVLAAKDHLRSVEAAAQLMPVPTAEKTQSPFLTHVAYADWAEVARNARAAEEGRRTSEGHAPAAPDAEPAADRKCTCPWDRLYANGCKCGGK